MEDSSFTTLTYDYTSQKNIVVSVKYSTPEKNGFEYIKNLIHLIKYLEDLLSHKAQLFGMYIKFDAHSHKANTNDDYNDLTGSFLITNKDLKDKNIIQQL